MNNEAIFDHISATRQVEKIAMVRATIGRKVEDLIRTYPKIPVAQLLAFIYRSKGEVQGKPWNWGDERTLKKIEAIDKELAETYNQETGEFNEELIEQDGTN